MYTGRAYPNVFFEVDDAEGKTKTYKTAEYAVAATESTTAHAAALSVIAGDLDASQLKALSKSYIGFTFAPELSGSWQGGEYNLTHFNARSRTLNSPKSPINYSEGFYAADYYMKSNGTVSYQPIDEDMYREKNAAKPLPNGGLMYGNPVHAAKATLSESIQRSIKEVLIGDLTFDQKYNEPSYGRRAIAIYSLAKTWEFTHARAPRWLPSNASASQFQAATSGSRY
jgi:hypothetical protein